MAISLGLVHSLTSRKFLKTKIQTRHIEAHYLRELGRGFTGYLWGRQPMIDTRIEWLKELERLSTIIRGYGLSGTQKDSDYVTRQGGQTIFL